VKFNEDLTQERLKELLRYDCETGMFYWLQRRGGTARKNSPAGYPADGRGYTIMIERKNYKTHRLAWLYVYGTWPEKHIDHIDGNPHNNKIENIRDVHPIINKENLHGPCKNSTSGFLGVTRGSKNRFQAQIGVGKKKIYLGFFKTPELAYEAYLQAKRRLHAGCTI
jgi:hypothetical protein